MIEIILNLRLKKDESNDIMQKLVKLHMNSLFENIRKDITEKHKSTSEFWMGTEHDKTVFYFCRLS